MKYLKNLGVQIALAMVIGVIVGLSMEQEASIFAPLGDVFIQLIKMLVVPLIAISVLTGAASIGGTGSAGKIGVFTLGFYLLTSIFAVALGLIFGEVFQPGAGLDQQQVQGAFTPLDASQAAVPGFWDILIAFIPANPVAALAGGNILQILFFSIFLGFGIATLERSKREPVVGFFNHLVEALIWMIEKVMLVAPIGVFGLTASAAGSFGYDLLWLVFNLFWVYCLAIAAHWLGFIPLLLKLMSNFSVKEFFQKMAKAQIVAFSTASSMATLPINFEVCEKEMKIPNSICAFVLPLGATINMNGNAIYYALVAVFSAQIFGIDLSFAQYVAIVITATIGSIGQAGVPGPTLLVVAVLVAANIPIEALPLLYAADRLFDMIRTALNITGDATCAVICNHKYGDEIEPEPEKQNMAASAAS